MLAYLLDIAEWVSVDQRHDYCMTVRVDRPRSWKPILMQDLHKGELSHGRKPRQVKPVKTRPTLNIFTVIFNRLERPPTKPRQFEHNVSPIHGLTFVDIRFLAHTDFADDILDNPSLHKRMQGQIVIA